MKSLMVVLLAVIISGCALNHSTADIEAKRQKLIETTPVCEGEADCKVKWEAAQIWIVRNAGFKLQVVTDVLLQTYNSNNTAISVQATKEPAGSGKYKILVSVSCGNMFACHPNQWDAAINFNEFVSAAKN